MQDTWQSINLALVVSPLSGVAHNLVDKKDVALNVMSLGQEMGEHEIQNRIVQDVQGKPHLVTYLATVLQPPPPGTSIGFWCCH